MNKPQLLIVDDELDIAEFISDLAQDMGFDVKITTSAEEFQQIFNSTSPAGIIMDIVMPKMDGNELLKWIAEQNRFTPIILMSGYAGKYLQATKILGEAYGAIVIGALEKPFRAHDIEPLMQDILNKKLNNKHPDL